MLASASMRKPSRSVRFGGCCCRKGWCRGSCRSIDQPMIGCMALVARRYLDDAKLFGAGMELVSIKENLIDQVWGAERPPFPMNVAIVHPLEVRSFDATAAPAGIVLIQLISLSLSLSLSQWWFVA